MRVLMLSWEYPPHVVGGLGRHVMHLAPSLVAQGVAVHILTPLLRGGEPDELTPGGVRIHRVVAPRMEEYSFLSFTRETNTAIERAARDLRQQLGDFTLIHAHDWLVASAAVTLKHAWRRPLISTIHATERGRQQGHLGSGHSEQIDSTEWWLTYEAWRVIACSRFMAAQVGEYFTTPADKVDVVPNGVHLRPSPFLDEDERLAYRRTFAADDQQLVFYVGRLVYEKGVHVLLDAWPRVLESMPSARLVIAGTGEQLEALKQRAHDYGVTDRVTFTGFISDEERDRLYAVADVATFPSIYEPFGIVALEAMAATCPVVVSATGGLAEVVRLHETGLTVHPNDPGSLAWGILHTLAHPEWSRSRSENAVREVRTIYSWARVGALTAEVYRRTHDAWRASAWGAPPA
jgi:glycogen synthase